MRATGKPEAVARATVLRTTDLDRVAALLPAYEIGGELISRRLAAECLRPHGCN